MTIKYFMDYIRESEEIYEKLVTDFMYELEEKYPVTLFMYYSKFGKVIILSQIVINDDSRNQGIGTQVMQEICDFADENNLSIGLTPSPDFGGNVIRLKKFYKNFGFEKYKGYRFKQSMIRKPN
jgi:GNAT superfamily N-acetyltransferase